MHTKLTALALFVLAGFLGQDPEIEEPKRQIEVVVDGVAHRLVDGGEVSVKVGDRDVKLLARVLPTRRFAAAGIGFEYPTNMAFEFADDASLRSWTFDGNDVVLTVRQSGEMKPDEFADAVLRGVRKQFQSDKEPVPQQLKLGGKDRASLALEIAVAGNILSYRAVPIVGPKGGLVLMLQDSGPLDRPSDELKRVLDLLAKTFVVAAK